MATNLALDDTLIISAHCSTMKILADTSVWSLALQRPKSVESTAPQIATVKAHTELIQDARAALMGAVRQELLCGIKTAEQFETLRDRRAAQAFNTCRAHGEHCSNTDFPILRCLYQPPASYLASTKTLSSTGSGWR